MKILLINKFLFPKGGDAICTLETGELLRANGHEVVFWGMKHPDNPEFPDFQHFVDNVDYTQSSGITKQLRLAANLLYSIEAKKKVEFIVKKEKPDIVHLHNIAHQISPSILHVFKKYNISVVMTLHDYKLVCPAYSMLSNGKVCEKCKGGRFLNCFFNKCTKESSFKSLLNTIEIYLHHSILRIYDLVDIFISPSKFLKNKIEEMGFRGKVVYLPNFVNLNDFIPQFETKEPCLVYYGRLSKEKGLPILLAAVKGFNIPVKIIGDGPMKDELKQMVEKEHLTNVQFLGYMIGEELKNQIRQSFATIVSSECYENNPRSIIEAFALGKPVLGSRIGGIPELVRDGETGLTFEPGNAADLREKISYIISHPKKAIMIGKKARKFVEQELNAERHYERLMQIYQSVMK